MPGVVDGCWSGYCIPVAECPDTTVAERCRFALRLATARFPDTEELTILKTVVSQIDILETMTPVEFNSFRSL